MATNNITFLEDLDIQKDDFTVKVRIVRLWKQPVFKNPDEIYSIEMILMVEQGTKIQANVLQKWVPKFRNLLQEGVAIFIKNPTIARHATKYKLIDNTNKLSLYYKTSVSNCRDFKGSIFGFSFVKFAKHISKSIPTHTAVDVIGEVIACETMVTLPENNGKAKTRMQVEMHDLEGIKMQVTLWDAFAQELNDYVSTNKDKGIVILVIQFAMAKIYRERPFLSNSFNGTRLFINSDIDEIKDFNKSETVEAKSLILLGTVKAFRKDVPWFYMGCTRCNRKVRPMYTITDKDDGSCMKEAVELYEKVKESGDLDMFPDDLDVLLDWRFAIKIDITDYNIKNSCFIYGISKLTDDDVILNELEMRCASQQPGESESVNLHSTDFSSQDKLKNATPSNVDKSTTNNPESEEKLCDRRLMKGVDRKRLFESWSDADQEGKGLAIKTLKIPKVEK
ncbi:replication protein A 70 kDa DNA-binding subunit E-like [Cynara cardunculus var. scolymus]|uniref:replication protein A 70 kDa DNA-binding subunit E-like n=1 Tax=Cynara cardunculus var. scolymus TaxID=59895 RepID=UPI000D62E7C8|nr:replication protein A 70 kDa DNA-binding subunit E-like [Cynara cardunculus var. scolymus]